MKWITIILALYITLLTVKPCVDGEVMALAKKEMASAQGGHSHDRGEDSCSPFCICSCCGVHMLNTSHTLLYEIPVLSVIIRTPITIYKSHFASTFSGSIWQPPQIV